MLRKSIVFALAGMSVGLVIDVVQLLGGYFGGDRFFTEMSRWTRLSMHAAAILQMLSLVVFFSALLLTRREASPFVRETSDAGAAGGCVRITRREYWRRTRIWYAVSLAGMALLFAPFLKRGAQVVKVSSFADFLSSGGIMLCVGAALCFLAWAMTISPMVGRFRDCNYPAWLVAVLWAVSFLVPRLALAIQTVMLFIAFCVDGTVGDNRYGRDPKGRRVVYVADLRRNEGAAG